MIPALLHPTLVAAARTIEPDGEVESLIPTNNPAHGDYQWNFAFRVGKAKKMNPRALAESLAPLLKHDGIVSADVAGPGFINLKLDDSWLAAQLSRQFNDPEHGIAAEGRNSDGTPRTVVIDYSSPNVAKRMHIGHMRSTHIGHALDRMHRAAGWRVIADNHIGDWGTPFGKLMVAWDKWRDEAAYRRDGIGELERLYVMFGDEVKRDETLAEQARAKTAQLQRGEAGPTALWREFLTVSMAEFDAVYRRMGVTFDETLGESAYKDDTDGVIADLLAGGVVEESEGAIIARNGEQVAVVRKRDGAVTYTATDLACVRYRMQRWNPDRIVYVTDMRQQGHFANLFQLATRWGVKADLVHAWFGMLVLPEGEMMSTRDGNVIRLVDLLDEAARRARLIVDDKAATLSEAERADIAEAVGVGSVRYADLSQHPQTNVTFTWDRMLAMEGNTAPYLLYSHARAATLLGKAGESANVDAITLTDPLERDLAMALLRYPEAVSHAVRTSRPNVLGEHLFEIANRFNRFYHELPVLTGGDARASRLGLVDASRAILRHGLTLLGLRVLDRM